MKKIFIAILIFVSFLNYAQSKILDFKPGYSPETIYNQTTTNSSDYEITYSGSEKVMEVLKNNGTENPTNTKNSFNVETVSVTGKIDKEKNFPIRIEYLKATNEKGKVLIPSGTLLYGNATLSSMPKLDSIVSKDMEDSLKKSTFETVQSAFDQLALPAKKLKINESFSQESPLIIPMAGINIEMAITTTYTLKSMTAKKAFFDIVQVYAIKILDTKFDVKGSGSGVGSLNYDILNHFIDENILNMKIDLQFKYTDLTLNLKSQSSFNQSTRISKK